jgi:calcineurin-like phosphoesterase family protein
MSNRVFTIADTHFGHKNIINYEPETRPFDSIDEHDEELVRRWNDTVCKNDTVWHLGDAVFGAHNLPILGRLNGVKHLVMGNHDHYPVAEYMKYFSKVHGAAQYRGCILTHIPVHPGQLGRFKGNVHGHLHSYQLSDRRYVCVSAELTNLTPLLMDTVIWKLLEDPRA